MAPKSAKRRIVVDGSNIGTEGRSSPSLAQLDQAIRAFLDEHPGFGPSDVTVVVDATFGHRIDPSERPAFEQALEHGEMLTPPAGAVGRGDGFILRIAEKAGALVLSNDSFQEFHAERPWLFEPGRLIGGKPVPGIGWVFTPRTPVRGPKSRAAVNRRSEAENGASTGSTGRGRTRPAATKALKSQKAAKDDHARPDHARADRPRADHATANQAKSEKAAKNAKLVKLTQTAKPAKAADAPPTKVTKLTRAAKPAKAKKKTKASKAVKAVVKAVKAAVKPTKATKASKPSKAVPAVKASKATKTRGAAREVASDGAKKRGKKAKATAAPKKASAQKQGAEKAAGSKSAKKTVAGKAAGSKSGAKKAGKGSSAAKAAKSSKGGAPVEDGATAAGSSAINDPMTFLTFVADHPVGSTVEGTVVSFTSHGAHIAVGDMMCHVPLRGLGRPAPTRARQVLAKGETRRFVLVSLDAAHRRAELALPGVAR